MIVKSLTPQYVIRYCDLTETLVGLQFKLHYSSKMLHLELSYTLAHSESSDGTMYSRKLTCTSITHRQHKTLQFAQTRII